MLQTESSLHYRFIRKREHDHVVKIKDKIRNEGVLATGPSDSFHRCAKKRKNLPSVVFQVHSFGKHRKRKGIFTFFPLDPALNRFSDTLFLSKQDKQPKERKLKIKTVVFSLPSLNLDFQLNL